MNTTKIERRGEGNAPHWSDTPEGRKRHYAENPDRPKRGRAYKNPNLVPQGLADHIRELTAQRDELLAALKEIAALPASATRYDSTKGAAQLQFMAQRAIAKAEQH